MHYKLNMYRTFAASLVPPTWSIHRVPSRGKLFQQPRPEQRLRLLTCLLVAFSCAEIGDTQAIAAETDKSVFLANCASCHGPDGRARTPAARKLGVKDLTQSQLPDAEIRRQIIEGRLDKAGKPLMPAYGEKLTGEQITALIATVKSFRK